MSLLGEEVVVEWLNRDGYFTIRGIKSGGYEIDILAIKPLAGGGHKCRHVEVQQSITPIGYITCHGAKKRSDAELKEGVDDWIEKKFNRWHDFQQRLCPGEWTKELVLGNVTHKVDFEIAALEQAGVNILRLKEDIIEKMPQDGIVTSAVGADLFNLTCLFREVETKTGGYATGDEAIQAGKKPCDECQP